MYTLVQVLLCDICVKAKTIQYSCMYSPCTEPIPTRYKELFMNAEIVKNIFFYKVLVPFRVTIETTE